MLVPEEAFGRKQRCVLAEALVVHEQVLPVHVDLDVVDALRAEGVNHVQRHPDVAHEDLHRRLGVLVLEEEQDSVFLAPLRRLPDPVDEPRPALGVRRLERVVVALDPRPDDEVRAELAGEVDGLEGALHGFGSRRRRPASTSPPFPKRGSRWRPVAMQYTSCSPSAASTSSRLSGVELLRVVELVAVDEVAEPVDRATHPLRGRLAGPLRLVAARDEARHHRPEGPDSERGLHGSALLCRRCRVASSSGLVSRTGSGRDDKEAV